jgi:hypothetical protein
MVAMRRLMTFLLLVSSVYGAEFGDVPANLTMPASNSVRRNAADTAFEAYVPGTGGGTVTSITSTAPIVVTPSPITTTGTISITQASSSTNGYLSSTDWNTFNGKGADVSGASFITKVAESGLSNEFALGSLATGLLKNTTTTGVPTIAISGTDYEVPITASQSVTRTTNNFTLTNDTASPGNSKYYGTDSGGTRGFFTLPSGASFANPTAIVGLTTVNGSASTAMRSDAAPPLDVSISPTWTGTHTWQNATGGHTFLWNGTGGTGKGLLVFDNETASPLVGSGTTLQFRGLDSTTAAQLQADLNVEWTDVTHATRKARVRWRPYNAGAVGEDFSIWGGGGATLGTGLTTAPGVGVLNVATGYQLNSAEFPIASNGLVERTGANTYSADALPLAVSKGGIGATTFAAHNYFGNNTGSTAAPAPHQIDYSELTGTPTIPSDISGASYITKVSESGLSNEFALGSLATGLLKNTTTTGVPTIAVAKTDYWDTTDFVASGGSHAHGLVPDPGSSAGTAKFLREDATWTAPTATVTAPLTLTISDAATNTTPAPLLIGHNTSSTATTNFGTMLQFNAQDSTTADSAAGRIVVQWTTATHGSNISDMIFSGVSGGVGVYANPMTLKGNGILNVTTGFTVANAAASNKFLQSDGVKYTASAYTLPALAGTSGKVVVSDGTNLVMSTPTFPNASATSRKIIVSDGTNWTASTETWAIPGTAGNTLTSDGTNWTSIAPDGSKPNSTASATSWTPDFDTYSMEVQTALAGAVTINAPTWTGTRNGTRRILRIKDNGTARAITWTTGSTGAFRASSDLALPTTTTLGKTMYLRFYWNNDDTRWDFMAKLDNF